MPHLLLADDNLSTQLIFKKTLSEHEIEVSTFGSGQAALEAIRAEQPDFVFANVSLAQLNGYDLAEQLRADPATAHLPIVLLVGAFFEVDGPRVRQLAVEVLRKPCDASQIAECVLQLQSPGAPGEELVPFPVPVRAAQPGGPIELSEEACHSAPPPLGIDIARRAPLLPEPQPEPAVVETSEAEPEPESIHEPIPRADSRVAGRLVDKLTEEISRILPELADEVQSPEKP